jgi:hypothetical protein
MYTESDWARTWFTTGGVFDAHPEWELHLDARPGAPWETLEAALYSFLRHTVGLRALMAAHARAQAAAPRRLFF